MVEWGVRRGVVDALMAGARLRDGSPFTNLPQRRDVTWVESSAIAEVSYAEIVDGRLRAAVLRAVRLSARRTEDVNGRWRPAAIRCVPNRSRTAVGCR